MSLLGNIIWFIFGGFFMGLAWLLWGIIAIVSIVGIPWARACFVLAGFSFFPFGYKLVNRRDLNNQEDIGTGALGLVGNIIWVIFGGVWLALGHLISAIFCAVTIIGIPFAIQHIKLVILSFAPIGLTKVPNNTQV